MSNAMTLFLQNNPLLAAQGALDEDTLAVAGNANGKRISIKGGVFRKIAGGKEVGQIEDRHMNLIFVKMAHAPSRQFYPGAFVEGDKATPVCWSNDSKTPDEACTTKQAATCDKCQWSVKGSGRDGKSSACRLAWRTAVVLPNDPQGDVMGFSIPAASCFGNEESGRFPFRGYVQMLANHNISAGRVITKVSFDTAATMPRVLFSPVSAVPPEDLTVIASQAKSHDAENAVKLTIFIREATPAHAEAPQPFQQVAPAPVAPAALPAPAAPQAAGQAAPVVSGGFVPVAPQPVQAQAAPAEAPQAFVEPVLRSDGAPVEAKAETDVSDIVKKWSTKKGA